MRKFALNQGCEMDEETESSIVLAETNRLACSSMSGPLGLLTNGKSCWLLMKLCYLWMITGMSKTALIEVNQESGKNRFITFELNKLNPLPL